MTAKDVKLKTWYLSDNGWSELWFYGINRDKWIIFDPWNSSSLSIVPELIDDDFDENPPKQVNKSKLFSMVFDSVFNKRVDVMF